MLLSLSIRDFVLVHRLDLAFSSGFGVLTGETGAGKSILLGALNLALGGRAEGDLIRQGAERAEITAEFSCPDTSPAALWLQAQDLVGDPGLCLVRRSVESGGRSRAQINGVSVTQAQLKALGECLIDIHGQHAHYSLLKPARQMEILDEALGLAEDTAALAVTWRDWKAAEHALAEAARQGESLAQTLAQYQWVADDLRRLGLQAEEWAQIQVEHSRLAHAADLLTGTQAVATELAGDEMATLTRLSGARQRLSSLVEIDPQLAETQALIDSAMAELEEAARSLNRYAERIDIDPQALSQIELRMADISATARRHQVAVEALPELFATAQQRLAEAQASADLQALQQAAVEAGRKWQAQADRVSAARAQGAVPLAAAVTAVMQELAMAGGRLEIVVERGPAGPQGQDSVAFQVAPHAGQGLKSLAQTASGGELSRIGLALQTVLAADKGSDTLVFDEVDAGIGGRVASVLGQKLAALGRGRQVICVTHLPQVAAAADYQFAVSKTLDAGQAITAVQRLEADARIDEIARMLGGLEMTATTRQHAAEMIRKAATV
ncbi:MAG: DNA repair protein RecN [Betaproteobacteria bacterium]|nr:DNA repair protein RecN [Betaproteobacteria bacterium]